MYKLGYILKHIDDFEWSDALFLPECRGWNKDTEGMILDPDDVEDDEDEAPKIALEKNLMYSLSIQTIQEIVSNLFEQKCELLGDFSEEDFSEEELVKAFLFYYNNDAFIVLDE